MDLTEPLDVPTALARLGGIATTAELRKAVGHQELRAAVAAGLVVRAVRGRYVLPDAGAAEAARCRVNGTLAGLSAAQAWGWKVRRPPREPCVIVPRHRRLSDARRVGVEVHWADLDVAEVADSRTRRVRTVLDCAAWLDFADALAVADSAIRSGTVSHRDLLVAARALDRSVRRRVLRVVEAADGRAANPFESALRAIALDVPGLDARAQVRVGDVGRADIGDARLRVVAEAESWEYHGDHDAFNVDIRRYTAMVRIGWLVVRFTWDDVMHRPDYVHSVLLDLVRLRTEVGAA